jgi:hypothetical protein
MKIGLVGYGAGAQHFHALFIAAKTTWPAFIRRSAFVPFLAVSGFFPQESLQLSERSRSTRLG